MTLTTSYYDIYALNSCSGSPLLQIVEDNPAVRALIQQMVEPQGYATVRFEDGPSALEYLQANRPDLVLLDWQVPGLAGEAIVPAVRALHRQLPIIIITGCAKAMVEDIFGRTSILRVLQKPFQQADLLDCISELLGRNGC